MDAQTMRVRAALMRELRAFFDERGYLEVDTPTLTPALIPEPAIASFRTVFESPFHPSHSLYLVPSPEVYMKRLLAAGSGDIFQLCRCFRNAEQIGRQHNPEFTMLEWYSIGRDYLQSAALTGELLRAIAERVGPALRSEEAQTAVKLLRTPVRKMRMQEAVQQFAGVDLERLQETQALREAALEAGVPVSAEASWEECFNALFLQLVEPQLPMDAPLILYEYPKAVPTLARSVAGTPWSERWELYIRGVEIANCYTEESSPEVVRAYYRRESLRVPPGSWDPSYPDLFANGFPDCSGVALGVDRLLMVLLGARELGGVIFFPFIDILESH